MRVLGVVAVLLVFATVLAGLAGQDETPDEKTHQSRAWGEYCPDANEDFEHFQVTNVDNLRYPASYDENDPWYNRSIGRLDHQLLRIESLEVEAVIRSEMDYSPGRSLRHLTVRWQDREALEFEVEKTWSSPCLDIGGCGAWRPNAEEIWTKVTFAGRTWEMFLDEWKRSGTPVEDRAALQSAVEPDLLFVLFELGRHRAIVTRDQLILEDLIERTLGHPLPTDLPKASNRTTPVWNACCFDAEFGFPCEVKRPVQIYTAEVLEEKTRDCR